MSVGVVTIRLSVTIRLEIIIFLKEFSSQVSWDNYPLMIIFLMVNPILSFLILSNVSWIYPICELEDMM